MTPSIRFASLMLVIGWLSMPIFSLAQTQTVRLKDVPLTEEVEGEKKKFKFDFSTFIPDAGKESKIYLVSRFCYNGQNFIVQKKVSSPKFTFTVKYYVDQFLEIRINSFEGLTFCVGAFKINDYSVFQCSPLGMEIEWTKIDSMATDFKKS